MEKLTYQEAEELSDSSIQETLYLMKVPGLYEDLKEGLKASLEECTSDSKLKW